MTLRDFNYGRPLQETPPIYLAGMKLARRLSQEALRASQQAWALEMALWKVRIATTGEEKAIAVQALIKEMAKWTSTQKYSATSSTGAMR